MYGARLGYEVEVADTQSDGTEYRLVRTAKGRNAKLYPALDELVETLSERQARELRDSLDEALEDSGTESTGTYCRNCSLALHDPKNAGFQFEGAWYCSGMCAEVAVGFWTRGNEVGDYNAQLADDTASTGSERRADE